MDPISRTNASTPISSPGLFSPAAALHHRHPKSQNATPSGSPLLHPLQMHRVRETHEALIEKDFITGRKLINQYEIIDEIGRGQHGKVKLARSLETGVYVAIKIIQRFSKTRRLGKVTTSPETKTKREIAILKKIRHENVVGLLEVIDDPELKKIYMVLEHVAFGEIQWRKKGVPTICAFERRRIERDIRGELDIGESEKYFRQEERRRRRHEAQRRKLAQLQQHADHWSNEHGNDDEDDSHPLSRQNTDDSTALAQVRSHTSILKSNPGSRVPSATPSANSSRAHTPLPIETDIGPLDSDNEDDARAPLSSTHSRHNRDSIHESVFGSYQEDAAFRGRSPSMADSIISHMSSNDGYHDPFEDDFSYVPCFTFRQARAAFRDTVLGLEYLHYEGIVHRDIKPANLLWTKSGHVKISDFGVSYFGRPIRDGEPEENVSESDARDFDNDLELAKTVGTPAFFAPELCFTDLNIPQPKVSEQIDVWSLGVTLYCLIYARIPFLAEDEWQLFRAIAQEEVHIPRRRLKPVDTKCKFEDADEPAEDSSNFRDEHELELEDIDDELYDLLKRMMIKDPAERIKLREVKRHPWVIRGIPDVLGWLDDTDPSRAHAGRRIQVDDRELERAVVPITFLERARSAVKKAVGKVIGATRGDRSEGSRKRATSSVGSSSGEVSQVHTPLALTPTYVSLARRPSLKGEDTYFPPNQHAWEQQHPLSQSVTVSPDERTGNEDSFDQTFTQLSFPASPKGYPSSMASDETRPGLPERTVSAAASIQTVVHRGHGRSGSVTIPSSTGILPDTETLSDAYYSGHDGGGRRYARRGSSDDGLIRAKSVDRVLFTSDDKHGEASIAISTAVAPGAFQRSRPSQESLISKSFDSSPSHLEHYGNHSQYFFTPYMIATHQNLHMQPSHNPHNSADHFHIDTIPEERPSTATQKFPNAKTPTPRLYRASTPESFAKAQVQLARRQQLEIEADRRKHDATIMANESMSESECPPSPDYELFMGRENDLRQKSSSSINSSGILSPISTFDVASPTSSVDLDSSNGQPIASDQSLPQLISTSTSSSASYISKTYLMNPSGSDHTPETTTPTTLTKQNSVEDETPNAMSISSYFTDDDDGYTGDQDLAVVADYSDDSDEGLTMGRRKGKKFMLGQGGVGRRGTNASVGSTETAKKVPMNG